MAEAVSKAEGFHRQTQARQMNSWDSTTLDDLYAEPSRNGLTRPKSVRGRGYRMINMGEIFAHERIGNIEMELVQMTEKEIATFGVKKGDLLFARQSLVLAGAGKCSLVKSVAETTTFESHLIRVRLNSKRADPAFYFYYFISPRGKQNVQSIVMQVAAAGIRGSELAKLKVPVPPLPVQWRIAGILSAYDELMENSQRRIRILEAMARALYREWFVHFRFPGHEKTKFIPSPLGRGTQGEGAQRSDIPQGWEVCALGDLVQFKSGFAFKSGMFTADGEHRLVTIRNVQDGAFNPESDSRMSELPQNLPPYCVLKDGDVLLSLTGNVGRVCLVYDGPFLLNQRVSKLAPVEAFDWAMTYCMFREPEMRVKLEQLSNGVAQQNLSPVLAAKMEFARPPRELRQRFAAAAEPMVRGIVQLYTTIQNLRRTRDLLLPRLLSGQVELAEKEKFHPNNTFHHPVKHAKGLK